MDNRAKVLKQTKREMSQLIECPVDDATSLCSANDTSESDDQLMKVPPTKKAKELSKF